MSAWTTGNKSCLTANTPSLWWCRIWYQQDWTRLVPYTENKLQIREMALILMIWVLQPAVIQSDSVRVFNNPRKRNWTGSILLDYWRYIPQRIHPGYDSEQHDRYGKTRPMIFTYQQSIRRRTGFGHLSTEGVRQSRSEVNYNMDPPLFATQQKGGIRVLFICILDSNWRDNFPYIHRLDFGHRRFVRPNTLCTEYLS